MDILLLSGIGVTHQIFGHGTIKAVTEHEQIKHITVYFDGINKSKEFVYPEVFKKHLKADSYLDEIADDLRVYEDIKSHEKKSIILGSTEIFQNTSPIKTKSISKCKYEQSAAVKTDEELSNIKRRAKIKTGDSFDYIVDILNECFGTSYHGFQISYFDVGNGYHIWCPKLAILDNGRYRAANKTYGFINILRDDGDIILEGNEDPGLIKLEFGSYPEKRAVFTKQEGYSYIFQGVYEYGGFDKVTCSRIHKRISTELELSWWSGEK